MANVRSPWSKRMTSSSSMSSTSQASTHSVALMAFSSLGLFELQIQIVRYAVHIRPGRRRKRLDDDVCRIHLLLAQRPDDFLQSRPQARTRGRAIGFHLRVEL